MAATAALVFVRHGSGVPPVVVSLLLVALASNVALGRLPARTLDSAHWRAAILVADTAWVTAALLFAGAFGSDFFYLYFLVVLLMTAGHSLALVLLAAIVTSAAYLAIAPATLGWPSAVVHLVFFYVTSLVYGYHVDRTRKEKSRLEEATRERLEELVRLKGELLEKKAREAEEARRARARAEERLREEAEVLASLGRMGQELLGGLDDPLLCDLLCRRAAELTGADKAQLFLRRDEDGAFAYAASHGLDPTDLETARMLEIPSELFETSAENGKGFPQLPSPPPGDHRTVRLFRGGLCIGALVLSRSRGTFDEKQERILSGIGPVASLAFEAARLFRALEAANSMKSDFIALVSHELRTPLNVILGYVSLLLEGDFGPLGAEQRNVLARVEESARKLCALVGETLELRRLLTARVPVHVAETDVGRVLDEVLAECEEAARRKPLVALRLEPPRSHGTIRTDPAKLASVLRQLVENALKFTDSGEVRVGWVEKNGGIEIFVRDTGPGIPEEKVSWIFEPFTQLEPVSTRQHGGAGLGLHLAKRLAELLGGTISVESRPGAGSTFRLWLPFRPPTELEPELFDTVV